jgi:hypothetical protein
LVMALFSLIVGLVSLYFSIQISLGALRKKGFANMEYGPIPFLKYIVFMILEGISSFFPWMDMRLLAIGIGAAVVLVILGIVLLVVFAPLGALVFLMAMLFGLVWYVYILVRLFPSNFFYLTGKHDMVDSIRNGWSFTNGKFWSIFGRILGVFIVLFIVFIGLFVISFIVAIPAALIDSTVFHSAKIGGPILLLTSVFFDAILAPLRAFVGAYAMVGIYSLFDTPTKSEPEQTPSGKPTPKPIVKKAEKQRIYDEY